MFYTCNNDILKSIYFAYIHSIVSCEIIIWGNSTNSRKMFTLQKRIFSIMVGAHPRTSCRKLFKRLEILKIPSQCIYSFMSFLIGNQAKFQTNLSVHCTNTRNKHHLHRPVANLSWFQKGASYSGIRIFNNLPRSITSLGNKTAQYKAALKKKLYAYSFYSVAELFACIDYMYYWFTWLCKSTHCSIFTCLNVYHMFHILLSCNSLRDPRNVCMNEWMMDEWMHEWMNEWMNEWMYVCMYVYMYVCMYVFYTSQNQNTPPLQT